MRCAAGLISRAAQAQNVNNGLASDFLQEFLETPLTGQAVFRVAAHELRSAVNALSDTIRHVLSTV